MDPVIAERLCRGYGCINIILVEYGNPDNRAADISIKMFFKYILSYRTGTLVTSQWACGGEQGDESNQMAIGVKSLFQWIEMMIQGNYAIQSLFNLHN